MDHEHNDRYDDCTGIAGERLGDLTHRSLSHSALFQLDEAG